MDVSVLKQQIKDDKLEDFYIFVGDEWAAQKIYINKIAELKKLPVKYIDSFMTVYSTIKNPSFIKNDYCYVVRDDKDIMSNDKIQQQIQAGFLRNNILILCLTQFDRRLKLFKQFESKYIIFDKMSVKTLKKYVKSEINLSDKYVEQLINICEQDYGRILLEIDKIKQFNSKDPDGSFKILINDGTIFIPPQDAVFDLVDAVLKKQVNRSYNLLQNCYDIGESNLIILSNLYSAAKQLLQVQTCDKGNNVMEVCGITYPQLKAAESRVGKYQVYELVDILKRIRQVEKGIKLGSMDEALSVEYVLVNTL